MHNLQIDKIPQITQNVIENHYCVVKVLSTYSTHVPVIVTIEGMYVRSTDIILKAETKEPFCLV